MNVCYLFKLLHPRKFNNAQVNSYYINNDTTPNKTVVNIVNTHPNFEGLHYILVLSINVKYKHVLLLRQLDLDFLSVRINSHISYRQKTFETFCTTKVVQYNSAYGHVHVNLKLTDTLHVISPFEALH